MPGDVRSFNKSSPNAVPWQNGLLGEPLAARLATHPRKHSGTSFYGCHELTRGAKRHCQACHPEHKGCVPRCGHHTSADAATSPAQYNTYINLKHLRDGPMGNFKAQVLAQCGCHGTSFAWAIMPG